MKKLLWLLLWSSFTLGQVSLGPGRVTGGALTTSVCSISGVPAPILCWPIDEGTGTTYVEAITGNNMTAQNNTWTAVSGFPNKMSFYSGASASNATAANDTLINPLFNGSTAFSVSFWFVDNTPGGCVSGVGTFWSTWTASYVGVGMRDSFSNSCQPVMYIINTLTTNWLITYAAVSGIPINLRDGNLHNLIVTYDGSRTATGVDYYCDNHHLTTSNYSSLLTASSSSGLPITLGSDFVAGTDSLTGAVGGMLIWNSKLTTPQANLVYAAGAF